MMSECTSANAMTSRQISEKKKNHPCLPLAVVIMMTAYGMHLAFSGRYSDFLFSCPIFSDLYRLLMECVLVIKIYVDLNQCSPYQDLIWKPDIALKNSLQSYKPLGDKSLNVHLSSEGGVTWVPYEVNGK